MSYSKQLAEVALQVGAIKINPDQPFTWASGNKMPIYNDNRLLLGNADHRKLVAEGLAALIKERQINADVVAGVATAGIPHATSLANLLNAPLIYVRNSAKSHGLQNQIEGILPKGQNVVVVEDLISTGGSALSAVEAVRQAGGRVEHCFCIFNYGFTQAVDLFQNADCEMHSLLHFKTLIQYMAEKGSFNDSQRALLEAWYQNPFEWARNQGLA